MTYCLPEKYTDPPEFAEYQTWFINSMVDAIQTTMSIQDAYGYYARHYNVKLRTNSFDVVEQVEFPSKNEAVLFVLKWS